MIELIAMLGATSAFCLAFSLVPSRNPMLLRISMLEGIQERSPSRRFERVQQIVKSESRSRLQSRLFAAGWYRLSPLAATLRGFGGLAAGSAIGLLFVVTLQNKLLAVVLAVLLALLGWRLPKILLDRAIKRRKMLVARTLPDFLDLLAATVRAGLALNMALVQVAQTLRGPLREELDATLAEIRLGRSRADALKAMAMRINEPQTSVMVVSIVQAEVLGGNISGVLHELALDTRNHRWMRAEEQAAKLPIKMLIPMGLFMIPSLYLMIFGPIVARLLAGLR